MSETVSIVIPTYKREDDLRACIESIAQQVARPMEVIVVDDAAMPGVPGAELLEAVGIECIYRRKNGSPGLTASRNLGCALARGEFLLYLDDDTELAPDYILRQLEVFRNDPDGRVAGASGRDTLHLNSTWRTRMRAWIYLPLLLDGPWLGRVLPSGYSTTFISAKWPAGTRVDCDILPGNNMMFRRDRIKDMSWTTEYEGYGLGEDQDFTYRLSRSSRLVVNSEALLVHKASLVARTDQRLRGRKKVFHQYLFYKRRVRRSAWQDPAFCYALFCHLTLKFMVMLVCPIRKNRLRVLGLFEGLGMILRRGGPPASL